MTKPLTWKFILSKPVYFIAFGFGVGLSPIAPGTFGTLPGYLLYFVLASFFPWTAVLIVLIFLFFVGSWWCDIAGKAIGEVDHKGIVWDEIISMALVLSFTPGTPFWWIVAFLFFRFFDIIKPWPIYLADRKIKNGFGVMFDDLLAAGYAIVSIKVVGVFLTN